MCLFLIDLVVLEKEHCYEFDCDVIKVLMGCSLHRVDLIENGKDFLLKQVDSKILKWYLVKYIGLYGYTLRLSQANPLNISVIVTNGCSQLLGIIASVDIHLKAILSDGKPKVFRLCDHFLQFVQSVLTVSDSSLNVVSQLCRIGSFVIFLALYEFLAICQHFKQNAAKAPNVGFGTDFAFQHFRRVVVYALALLLCKGRHFFCASQD